MIDWQLVVPQDSAIKTVRDFKGKTIGTAGLPGMAFLKSYLKASGLDPDRDVQIVPTGAGALAVQALTNKTVQGLFYRGSVIAGPCGGTCPPKPGRSGTSRQRRTIDVRSMAAMVIRSTRVVLPSGTGPAEFSTRSQPGTRRARPSKRSGGCSDAKGGLPPRPRSRAESHR